MEEKYTKQFANEYVEQKWNESMRESIEEFIRIPNVSRIFDKDWATNGLLEKAGNHVMKWAQDQKVEGLSIEMIQHEGKSPLIYMEHPGNRSDYTILFYGHFDKQPPFVGWHEGLDPYTPVTKDGRMYGRGGADDGYSIYSSILALKMCQEKGLPFPRVVAIFEGDEESGSDHLAYYIEKLKDRIKNVNLVFCLDSGCANYEQLWMTTSLRGVALFTLNVEVLTEGVHSGDASGIVPDSFRIARQLLDRIENSETGVCNKDLTVNIPSERYAEAEVCVKEMGDKGINRFPLLEGMTNCEQNKNNLQALLNNTWLPQLAVTGADGLPQCATAGNVLRPSTSLRCSLRLPPTLNPADALKKVKEILETNPPYGCKVYLSNAASAPGWNAPYISQELRDTFTEASQMFFDKPSVCYGQGGSIPLMGMLNKLFPESQFVISGLLGPGSNAHGPNEMFVIDYLKKFTASMGYVLAKSYSFKA